MECDLTDLTSELTSDLACDLTLTCDACSSGQPAAGGSGTVHPVPTPVRPATAAEFGRAHPAAGRPDRATPGTYMTAGRYSQLLSPMWAVDELYFIGH